MLYRLQLLKTCHGGGSTVFCFYLRPPVQSAESCRLDLYLRVKMYLVTFLYCREVLNLAFTVTNILIFSF